MDLLEDRRRRSSSICSGTTASSTEVAGNKDEIGARMDGEGGSGACGSAGEEEE